MSSYSEQRHQCSSLAVAALSLKIQAKEEYIQENDGGLVSSDKELHDRTPLQSPASMNAYQQHLADK